MGLGRSDGRRNFSARLLPTLNAMPFTPTQKATLDAKAWAVQNAPNSINPALNFYNPPADSDYFTVTPNPFPNYPAVGSGPIILIAFSIPPSKVGVIRKMAIVHFGGNPPDGTGKVIWRVLKNKAGLRGLGTLTAQYGTFAAPVELAIYGTENDTFEVTVEVPKYLPDGVTPNLGPPLGSTTGARFDGFYYPLSEATSAGQGS